MSPDYPDDPEADRPMLDARLHLMDRQILDLHGVPVAAVDDVEFTDPPAVGLGTTAEPPEVINLLTGVSLGTRIFGGRPPISRLHRIPWGDVFAVGVAIRLTVDGDRLDSTWARRWTRDHVIAHIPGAHHDPQ